MSGWVKAHGRRMGRGSLVPVWLAVLALLLAAAVPWVPGWAQTQAGGQVPAEPPATAASTPASQPVAAVLRLDGDLSLLPGPVPTQPLAGFAPVTAPEGRVWPWEGTGLDPDPSIRFGRLDNGMRYAIRVNTLPEEAVSLQFRIEVGSLHEEDSQLGYAHLVEHMAFNGSTNIPEGELISRMERLGASFGPDVNAFTSANETMYSLYLPRSGEGRLELALDVFRETASRLTISQEALDREKGVVANEAASRDNVATRLAQARDEALYPRLRATQRRPIGDMAIVQAATSQSVRAFYERWYRPDRAILVVVGAVDLDATEAMIRARFSDWTPAVNEPNPPKPENGRWEDNRAFAYVQVNAELPEGFQITVERPDPVDYGVGYSEERARWAAAMGAAGDLLNTRIGRLNLSEDPPFTFAGYGHYWNNRFGWQAGISFMGRDGNWRRALDATVQEVRLALDQGFTQEELDQYKTSAREGLRRAVRQEATRQTTGLALSIMGALSADLVPRTAAQNLERGERVIDSLTLADVQAHLRYFWQGLQPGFVVSARSADITPEALAGAWREALARPVRQQQAFVPVTFVPPRVGLPGVVASSWREASIDTDFVRFENGVLFAFKRTGFTRDRVAVNVTFGGGTNDFNIQDTTWAAIADLAWGADGFGALTADNLERAFSGRTSGPASTDISANTTRLSASVTPQDVAEQLQVMLAQTVEPRIGPLGGTMFRSLVPQVWSSRDLTASSVFGFHAPSYYVTGSPRFEAPRLEQAMGNDDAAGIARLRQILSQAPVMVTVVGDADLAQVRAAVAATFGTLPPRSGLGGPRLDTSQWRPAPTGGAPLVLTHRGPDTQAMVHVAWHVPGVSDRRQSRALSLLAEVMQLRVTEQIREAHGQSYSPSASSSTSASALDLERLAMTAQVKPGDVAGIETIMMGIARDLGETGPTADELARALQPLLERRTRARQSNSFWIGQIAGQGLPVPPGEDPTAEWVYDARYETDFQSVTVQELQDLARRYLVPANAVRVHVVPQAGGQAAPAQGPVQTPAQGQPPSR